MSSRRWCEGTHLKRALNAAKGYRFVVAAFAVSLLLIVFFVFAPMPSSVSQSVTVTVTQDGEEVRETSATREATRETWPESQGWRAVGKVAVPLLVLTGLPLLLPWRRTAIAARTASTALLFFGVLLGALSFWILYLPGAVLMLIAMIRALEERRLLEGRGQASAQQAP